MIVVSAVPVSMRRWQRTSLVDQVLYLTQLAIRSSRGVKHASLLANQRASAFTPLLLSLCLQRVHKQYLIQNTTHLTNYCVVIPKPSVLRNRTRCLLRGLGSLPLFCGLNKPRSAAHRAPVPTNKSAHLPVPRSITSRE